MVGTTIGHYTITSRLFVGSLDDTWLAHDASLDRTVALKLLPPGGERLREEVRAACAMDHPNVAGVHDTGELADGGLWVAMSWSGGQSLQEKEKAGPLPVDEAVGIAIQAGRGLLRARQAGLAHCDPSPGNIMVAEDGHVVILPAFQGAASDEESDAAALQALLSRMLGSDRSAHGELQKIINRRPGSLAEIVRELEWAAGKVSSGTLPRRTGVSGTKGPGRPLLLWGVLAAALLVAGGIGGYFMEKGASAGPAHTIGLGYLPSSDRVTLVLLPISNAIGLDTEDTLGAVITNDLMTDLVKVRGLRVISQSSAQGITAEDTIAQVGKKLGVDYVLKGSVGREGEEVILSLELWLTGTIAPRLWVEPGSWLMRGGQEGQWYTKEFRAPTGDVHALLATVAQEAAQNAAVRVTTADRKRITGQATIKPEARELYLKGTELADRRATPDALKMAIQFFLQAAATEPGYAEAWAALGMTLSEAGPGGTVPGIVVSAEEALKRALELDPASADVQFALGQASGSHHRYAEQRTALESAVTANPNLAQAHSAYAILLARYGRFTEAIAQAKESVRLDPLSFAALRSLGLLYIWNRQFADGVPVLLGALEMNPDDPLSVMYYGWLLAETGRFEEGIRVLERAVKLGAPEAEAYLGYVHARRGDYAEARAIAAILAGKWNPKDALGAQDIAMIQANLGEEQLAMDWLKKAAGAGGAGFLGGLDAAPPWDPLKSMSEFREMVKMPEWAVPPVVASAPSRPVAAGSQSRPVVFLANAAHTASDPFMQRLHDYIVHQTGVEFTYRDNSDDYTIQRDTAIAARAQIDVFGTYTQEMWRNRGRGVIRDITAAVNANGPNLKRLFTDGPGWGDLEKGALWRPATVRGRIWGIPAAGTTSYGIVLSVRKDWRERLGMAPIETIDQFETYLRKVKVTDLNGNGKADEIPFNPLYCNLGPGLDGIASIMTFPFIGATGWHHDWYRSSYVDAQGRIAPTVLHPEFKTFLARMAAWYRDGLLNPDLTKTSYDQDTARIAANTVGATTSFPDEYLGAWQELLDSVPNAAYEYAVLKGPGGSPARFAVNDPSGAAWTYAAWAPQDVVNAGIRLQDWFATDKDHYLVQQHGVRDVDWRYVDRRSDVEQPIIRHMPDGPLWSYSFLTYGPWESILQSTDWAQNKVAGFNVFLGKQRVYFNPDWFVPYDFKGTLVDRNDKQAADFIDAVIADIILNKAPLSDWDGTVAEYRSMWADQFIKAATAQYNQALGRK